MCRCWQICWEDFYWNCIEEKFCYDESIANYNHEDDEYLAKKSGNGFLDVGKLENNNLSGPICIQPSSARSNPKTPNISAGKIHEDDYRQIQTNAPILAPEIMSVFANSQIFHEHHAKKTSYPGVHGRGGREADSEKLLFRLEGNNNSSADVSSANGCPVQVTIEAASDSSNQSLAPSRPFSTQRNPNDQNDDEVILRPRVDKNMLTVDGGQAERLNGTPILNKRLRNVQSVPYFPFRPASENDIFAITGGGSMNQISMTPEIPSISYSTLPKHYEDTPTIEKYKENVSLYSIQTAQSARLADLDLSMPRYFRKSDIIAHSAENLSGGSATVVSATPSGSNNSTRLAGPSSGSAAAKSAEKSKRLKMLRTKLPPLAINLGGSRERTKDKGIE